MNSKQVKQVPITKILREFKGLEAVKQSGDELHYYSPFRDEKVPSFHVNIRKNVWHDKGTGEGGNSLDLVMELKDCSVREALSSLSHSNNGVLSPTSSRTQTKQASETKLSKVKELENSALIQYANDRGIQTEIVQRYAKEVYYTINNKPYFSIGLKNENGGYEARNRYFKGCIGEKGVSLLRSQNKEAQGAFFIFEGLFDFLSWVSFYNKSEIDKDVLILNSTALVSQGIDLLKEQQASFVYCFLDRNESGKRAFEKIQEVFGKKRTIDESSVYEGFEDFNEFLCHRLKEDKKGVLQ